jgi:hypothetical protein
VVNVSVGLQQVETSRLDPSTVRTIDVGKVVKRSHLTPDRAAPVTLAARIIRPLGIGCAELERYYFVVLTCELRRVPRHLSASLAILSHSSAIGKPMLLVHRGKPLSLLATVFRALAILLSFVCTEHFRAS